jgi:hypothetical protein
MAMRMQMQRVMAIQMTMVNENVNEKNLAVFFLFTAIIFMREKIGCLKGTSLIRQGMAMAGDIRDLEKT